MPAAPVSWHESANGHPDFPLRNLPYGVFRRAGSDESYRVGVALGDSIVDIAAAIRHDLVPAAARTAAEACTGDSLNALMALGQAHWRSLRVALTEMLRSGSAIGEVAAARSAELLVPMQDAEVALPARIGDYTDFYASLHHATNVGSLFRPDNPLLPNYKWVPIGYHGRASSIVTSGTPVHRPAGQRKGPNDTEPAFGPSRLLDYEMELGMFVGPGNRSGQSIALSEVEQHMFGVCIVNDWSARDLQSWEYQPLGPFLAKSFLTSVSPWVVTMEALEPFRCPSFQRAPDDPLPLPYLYDERDATAGGLDISVEVAIRTARMRDAELSPHVLSRGNFREMYWTLGQMLTHHASNGCNMRPGDLIASGTISGPTADSRGCLLEITSRGRDPVSLPDGDTRTFLQDGDEVIMRAWCEAGDGSRIGFGECSGVVTD